MIPGVRKSRVPFWTCRILVLCKQRACYCLEELPEVTRAGAFFARLDIATLASTTTTAVPLPQSLFFGSPTL